MCIVGLALNVGPRWRLVLAANRDERHDRPSAALAPWADAPGLLAGRDQVSGGGWLGVSTAGRLALVTNVRGQGEPDPAAPSRGRLVSDFLVGAGDYAAVAASDLTAFNPVNLITVDAASARFATNRPAPVQQTLASGVHGVSNGPLDEASAKVNELKAAVSAWLAAPHGDIEALYTALRSETSAGLGGGVFMRNDAYGTRCSTLVMVDIAGQGMISERRFDAAGAVTGQTRLDFRWA